MASTESQAETVGKRNWTLEEDLLLIEAMKRIHRKKVSEIKIHMEETGKVSRTEKEITNRIQNVWKTDGPYRNVYVRKEFKKENLKIESKIKEAELRHVTSENYREEKHNIIRMALLEMKDKDALGKSTDQPKETTEEIRAELLKRGEERKQNRGNTWNDVKDSIEIQRQTQEKALNLLERLEVNYEN